jgi:hypothetical protein
MFKVRGHFYKLYNNNDDKRFQELLASVGNVDAITGNRLFDRHEAVRMIKISAEAAKDNDVLEALDGHVYRCIVHIMNENDVGLRSRRKAYEQLTHRQAAE